MNNNLSNIKKSIHFLNKEECIAIPTETVYGLAANAYSNKATLKIFKLKKRSKKNPLIVHYNSVNMLRNDCHLNNNFYKLFNKFSPGPITFVLKKKRTSRIQSAATANLDTVAIRFPKHNMTRSVLKKINFPLAMPSANLSSGVSPISAFDVCDEFKKKLKIIINGGNSKIGIESTVISLTGKPRILRLGIIESRKISKFFKISLFKSESKIRSPGLLKRHYSPGIPIKLNQKKADKDCAFITFGKKYKDKTNHFNLSKKSDLKEAASNLYKTLRKIKNRGFKKINVVKIPNQGVGLAINDRLKRASY